jgi:homoserine O-acetyltransferase
MPRKGSDGSVRNGVLILHGTGGTGRQFLSESFSGRLFGKGQLLDANQYLIILPDNVGHGQSSKPSDGLRMKFPRYVYQDMVRLQYALVTGGVGLTHLRLVMGTSMGGMHTWMWGYLYPDFMDGLVPLASVPTQIAARNRVWRKLLMDCIRNDPTWQNGNYTAQPRGLADALGFLLIATSAPLQWQKQMPSRDASDAWLAQQIKNRMETSDANDMLYYFQASEDYDPSGHLEAIVAPLLAINSADDFVNPPELPMMGQLITRVKRGRSVLIPTSDDTRGHGTHSLPAVWGGYLEEFLKTLR